MLLVVLEGWKYDSEIICNSIYKSDQQHWLYLFWNFDLDMRELSRSTILFDRSRRTQFSKLSVLQT